MTNTVSLAQTRKFSEEDVKKTVYGALDLLDFPLIRTPKVLSLKVNLCYYWDPSTGETTDPRVVSSVIDYIRQKWNGDASIYIVESDASAVRAKHVFKMLGYEDLAAEKEVQLLNLSKDSFKEVSVSSGGRNFSFHVPRVISESDIFISMPKPKYHLTGISCALKNQFGCNPEKRKNLLHPILSEAIVALNKIMLPNLVVVDGITVRGENPRKLGLIAAGTNPVAVDFVMAKIMGLDPKKIEHLELAVKEGIGSVEDIAVLGSDLDHLAAGFPKMSPPSRATRTIERMKLWLYKSYLKAVNGVPL